MISPPSAPPSCATPRIKYATRSVAIPTIEFTKQDAKTPSSRTLRKVRSAMERDGAVAFANLFPLPLLKRLRAEVLRRHASGELHARGLVRDIAGRYAAVVPFEGPFLDPRFYADPKLRAMLAALLGEDYRISSLETVIAMPGAYRQHQHIDAPIRFDRSVGGKKIVFRGDLSGLNIVAIIFAAAGYVKHAVMISEIHLHCILFSRRIQLLLHYPDQSYLCFLILGLSFRTNVRNLRMIVEISPFGRNDRKG